MPAKAAFTFSRNFRDRMLERTNREHFDLVILNGSDLLWLETATSCSRHKRYARGAARVTQHGPVDNLAEVWSRCDLMICPMLTGSGVSTKLAEAVYHGVPGLATSLATR